MSLMAMLFLVVFSALALGFYSQTNMCAHVSNSEKRAAEALVASESGVKFIRYHLSALAVPPGLAPANAFEELYMQLAGRIDGTANLGGGVVGYDGTTISVPETGYVKLDDFGGGHKFRVTLTRDPIDGQLVVKSVGVSGTAVSLGRGIQLKFQRVDNPSTIWGFGVATKGPITLSGGIIQGSPDATRGSILVDNTATTAGISMSGSAVISGKVSLTNPAGTVSGSGSIGGTTVTSSWPITKGVAAPEFPTVDPTPYVNYLATQTVTILTGSPTTTNVDNVRIKANANPTFKAASLIRGVILVESPNKVSIPGGCTIQGVIVCADPNAIGTNQIVFSGGSAVQGPEVLPASFGDLRYMDGASILAPNFAVTMSGGSTSFGGSIVCKSLGLSGGSGGSTAGSVIMTTAASQTWSGGSGFTITNSGASKKPVGASFKGHFEPLKGTYLEVRP